jgi:ribosomal protein L11 methyltransferase
MKKRQVWRLSVVTATEVEDAVAEILVSVWQRSVSTYADLESGCSESCVYLDQTPRAWIPLQRELVRRIQELSSFGLVTGSIEVTLHRLAANSWLTSWKKHFRPLEIGSAVLVKPGWSKKRPKPGQVTVLIDPGLSFGTGQHPTTEFCLRRLAALPRIPGSPPPSLLDIGTGSGILAIAAAKLGFAPVHAFDFDPDSISVASKNAKRNRVLPRIQFWQQDVRTLPLRPRKLFTMVCANLLADLLLANRDRLIKQVEIGGSLVIAGILEQEFEKVSKSYADAGMTLVSRASKGEWCSGHFLRV